MRRPSWFSAVLVLALAATLAFLTLPILAIFLEVGLGEIISSLGSRGALEALSLSIRTTLVALAVIVVIGTPAAYLLGTRSFRVHSLVVTLIALPLVLPPAVAGIALLATLGPQGILGPTFEEAGIRFVFETIGVVVALVFVASPFFLRQAITAFAALDPAILEASRTLGAGPARTFFRVAVPAARPGLISGSALAWGRALGEFGATLIFAGSLAGVTQTAPLAIAERFATDFTGAVALSAVLVALSAALLLTVKLAGGPGGTRTTG